MLDINQSVLVSLVLVGVLAIPAASQSLPEERQNLGLESNESEPVEISTSLDSDRFIRVVSTAFETVTVNRTSNRSMRTIETSDKLLEVEETPGRIERRLENPEGLLIHIKESEMEKVEVHGPEGTLIERNISGSIEQEFEGTDLEALEDRKDNLMESMDEMMSENEGFQSLETDEVVSVGLEVQPDASEGEGEYLEIENLEDQTVELEDWRVEDDAGNSYTFDSGEIESGESIKLYTENSEADHNWGSGIPVWNQNGDTVYLYNEDDELVEEYSY
mgnify:FL=1